MLVCVESGWRVTVVKDDSSSEVNYKNGRYTLRITFNKQKHSNTVIEGEVKTKTGPCINTGIPPSPSNG
jgi:hypothetical protein